MSQFSSHPVDPHVAPTGHPAPPVVVPASHGSALPEHDGLSTLAAVVELLTHAEACAASTSAAEVVADRLKEHLQATNVIILWRNDGDRQLSLLAEANRNDPYGRDELRYLFAAAEEVAARGAYTCWPAVAETNDHGLMAVAQFATQISTSRIAASTLLDSAGTVRGVIITLDCPSDPRSILGVLAEPLGAKFASLERSQPTWLEWKWRSVIGLRRSNGKLIVGCGVAVLLVMLLPLRYRMGVDLELQPVQQRFVAVPFDAPLQHSHVRPGDVVADDELLATINPREIDFELAGVRAELHRAEQERKGYLAAHDSAAGRIAELETQKLRSKTELLEHRRNNLEIRSPIEGVVISGDLEPSEGMPMTRGEVLYEIAPLGLWKVELCVPESDFAHVRAGMPVSFFVHAYPDQQLNGHIERMHPRAELRDQANVYVAELRLEDPQHRMRPGMRGRASIRGDRHPLAWNLFHKAYYALRDYVGW